MNRHLAQDGVVLFQLQALGRVLAVFLSDVAGSTRSAGCLVLCALENYLDTVAFAFLGHGLI